MGRRTRCRYAKGDCWRNNTPAVALFSGVRATSAFTVTDTTFQVNFSECVSVNSVVGVEYRINGGAWTQVNAYAGPDDTSHVFDISPTTIVFGDDVEWRYAGGTDSIVTCSTSEDIGAQLLYVQNNVVRVSGMVRTQAGDFVLTENGDNVQLE